MKYNTLIQTSFTTFHKRVSQTSRLHCSAMLKLRL